MALSGMKRPSILTAACSFESLSASAAAAAGAAASVHGRRSQRNNLAPPPRHDKKGATMNIRVILIVTFCLSVSISPVITTSDAATSFAGSSIMDIDQDQRTVTFKTKDGQTWTLPVTEPEVLNRQQIAKGDQVTIEIDLNYRISKVVKLSEVPTSPRPDPRGEYEDR